MIKNIEKKIKGRKIFIRIHDEKDFIDLTIHARRFRKPVILQKKNTIYNKYGNPIIPIRTNRDKEKRHPFQRSTQFSKSEIDDILKRTITKKGKLELS